MTNGVFAMPKVKVQSSSTQNHARCASQRENLLEWGDYIMESDDDTEELLLFKSVFIKTEEETRPIAG